MVGVVVVVVGVVVVVVVGVVVVVVVVGVVVVVVVGVVVVVVVGVVVVVVGVVVVVVQSDNAAQAAVQACNIASSSAACCETIELIVFSKIVAVLGLGIIIAR